MDAIVYGLLNKKIKGLTSGVKYATVSGVSIVFTMNDNSKQTITFPTPKNGASIVDVEVNADNTITCALSDGTSVTSTNKINTIKGDDGFSPTITENAGNTDDMYKLDITDSTHTFTTPNLKGEVGNLADYQKKEDNTLDTTSKTIVGAINELQSGLEKTQSALKLIEF